MIPEPHPSVVDGLLFGASRLAPVCKKLAALSVRTHSSQDVTGDVVPSQVQPPQGSVAGETVHQGPAPQETDVIPAQVWKETCCHSVGWEVLAKPRMLPLSFIACGCQHSPGQPPQVSRGYSRIQETSPSCWRVVFPFRAKASSSAPL